MSLAMIVAASENEAIGLRGDLPWRLSADLKRFKELTMGHSIIMGRKTFETLGRLLPGRTTIILTRQRGYQVKGAKVVTTLEQALAETETDLQPFVIGGAEVYSQFLPQITEIYLTRVHAEIEGDTFLPPIDWSQWRLTQSERHAADAKNNFDYSFLVYHRSNGELSANRRD